MKILMVTNKVKTYALGFQIIIDSLTELGHTVVWAADFSQFITDKSIIPCQIEQISINTNPLNHNNRKAYKQLLCIIDKYHIESIVCSTPIGGALARLAAKKKHISPVLYEAHGFLFFKGAPLINRTIYKWEEVFLAHYTDAIITITEEDFGAAQKFKLRSGRRPFYVHGAGVNVGVTVNINRVEKRKSIGVPEDAFVIVSAGELNKNKNTEVIVRAMKKIEDAHYVVCGTGQEKENLEKLAKELGVLDRVHLIGYRTDMPEILTCADVFVMMSFREGLPRAILEAMDLALPCVGSDTRGIRDLIDVEGGLICKPTDPDEFANAIKMLKDNPWTCYKMGEHNRNKARKYSADIVRKELLDIYVDVLK